MLHHELVEVRRNITKASAFGKTDIGFAVGLHNTYKKLEELFDKKQESDIDEINIILDSMRYRIGATGKERVNSVNDYFQSILNICFPPLQRYLMWSAANSEHLFEENKEEKKEK
jgi:hypothetical protein